LGLGFGFIKVKPEWFALPLVFYPKRIPLTKSLLADDFDCQVPITMFACSMLFASVTSQRYAFC